MKQILILKKIILPSLVVLLLSSCGDSSGKPPLDKVSILKKQLATKKENLEQLQYEVTELQKEIVALDPSFDPESKIKRARLVSTHTVETKDFEQFAEFHGEVKTKGEYMASPTVGGSLISMTVKEGQRVSKGQLIGQTDYSIIQKNIEQLQSGLALARDVYQRRKKLWDNEIGSEIEYIKSKNDVESLEKQIATLQTQIAQTKIYAPAGGVVDMVLVKQGEMAGPGTPIVKIINTANVQVVASIPENYLNKVKRGDKVKVTIPSLEIERTATIKKISELINPVNRTFEIEIDIANGDRKLKPNLLAMVEIKEFEQKDAVIVPTNYIQDDETGSFVFVVNEVEGELLAQKTNVEVGEAFDGETAILSGLEAGAKIVSEGARLVSDGELVELVERE